MENENKINDAICRQLNIDNNNFFIWVQDGKVFDYHKPSIYLSEENWYQIAQILRQFGVCRGVIDRMLITECSYEYLIKMEPNVKYLVTDWIKSSQTLVQLLNNDRLIIESASALLEIMMMTHKINFPSLSQDVDGIPPLYEKLWLGLTNKKIEYKSIERSYKNIMKFNEINNFFGFNVTGIQSLETKNSQYVGYIVFRIPYPTIIDKETHDNICNLASTLDNSFFHPDHRNGYWLNLLQKQKNNDSLLL